MNLIPAVLRGGTHPSLYDRVVAAGKTPDYARPKPPTRWPLLLIWPGLGALLVFALVAAFATASWILPIRESGGDWAYYAAAALEGGDSGERAVVARLRGQGRSRDAIALLERTGATHDPDRLSQILWLELEGGDCDRATRTFARIEPSKQQRVAARTLRAFCPNVSREK